VCVVLVVACGGFYVFSQDTGESRTLDRFGAILNPEADQAFKERRFKWRTAWAEIDQHPQGFGLGAANERANQKSFSFDTHFLSVDNSYLKIAYEQGLAMALLLVVAILSVFVSLAVRGLSASDPYRSAVAIGGAGVTLAFGLELNFETIYMASSSALAAWLLIGLGLRHAYSQQRSRDGEPAAAAGPSVPTTA
jgi:hypothetical protein